MKRLEEETGEVLISSIRQRKKRKEAVVDVTLSDGRMVTISEDAYLSSFLYPGKKLDKAEWNRIISITNQSTNRDYVLKLLSGRLYSPSQLIDKLVKIRKMPYQDARNLISDLEEEGIVDAKAYAENRIDSLSMKGYSPSKIMTVLKEEGMTDEVLSMMEGRMDAGNESSALQKLSAKARIYRNDSDVVLRKKLEAELYKMGYSSSQADSLLERLMMDDSFISSDRRQKEALSRALRSTYDKIVRNEELTPPERRHELYRKLMAKGFSKDEIDEAIEMEDMDI